MAKRTQETCERERELDREYYQKNSAKIQAKRKINTDSNLNARLYRCYANSKQRAVLKGFEHTITPEYLHYLWKIQNGECALSGEPLSTSGDRYLSNLVSIDRVNNDKGYTEDNVQLVCVKYNMMRAHASINDFIAMCKTIVDYNYG